MKKSTLVLIVFLFGYNFSNGQEALSQKKSEQLFMTGLDLLSHHEYGTAFKVFGDFLKEDQHSNTRKADAEYYKAFCALNLYHADGEKQLENYIAANPLYPKAITAYYDLASFFYTEKNYAKASGYYSKVNFPTLSAEQQNTGRFRWGYSLFSQKDLKNSLDQFNTIKAQGGQYGPAASYYAGFIESSSGDYANAMIDLKRAEANSAYSTIVPVLITNIYYKQKDDNGLLAYTEVALARAGVTSADEISLFAAEAYFRKGDYKKAIPLYEEYLDNHEKNADRGVLYRAGYAAAAVAGNDDLALRYLKSSASDADSIGVYASYSLGLLYLKRLEKPLALTAFEVTRRFKKDPRLAEESLYQAAKINYDLGKPDIAINEFEQLLKEFPQSTHVQDVKETLSQVYVNANNYNKAIEYIDAMPKRTPAIDRAYQKATFLKGTELYNKEDYANAVSLFEKSLQYPSDPEIVAESNYWIGETYSIGRKYDQAIAPYERALSSTKPMLVRDIRYGLGYAYYNNQNYDKALVSFKDFATKSPPSDPNYLDGIIRLADSYYATKSYPEALTSYKKAIQLNSADADYAHFQSGIVLATLRRYNEAGAEFDAVAKIVSSRYAEDAVFQKAQMDFEQSNYTSAVSQYSKLINSSKSPRLVPYALSRRASSYYNLKNYSLAANDYITVFDKFPTHPVASQDLLVLLQESLNLSNKSAEFDKYLAEFKQANPDATGIESVEFETAKNFYFNQNYGKTIESFARYELGYPESPRINEAKYYEGESYYRLKDYSKSLETFQLISKDPTFTMQSKVVARIAELEYKLGHFEKAIQAFLRLELISTNKKEQATSWNGLMESYYVLAKYDSSEVYAKKILAEGNVNIGAQNKASLFLGKSAKARGDYETAKDEFITTLNTARDEYGAEAKYLLGEIFYLTKQYKQCSETLIALNSDFSSYDEWVGKSFLLLADNYLAQGEVFQAKGTLKSLIENHPLQTIKDSAKEKLKAIEQDELKKKTAEKADTISNDK